MSITYNKSYGIYQLEVNGEVVCSSECKEYLEQIAKIK